MMTTPYTGGCQCGAVRYRIAGEVTEASVCNCRMCQKAFGSFFAPLAHFAAPVERTRGRATLFRSSQNVARGFCSNCGTPLSYQVGDREPSVSIGSLDKSDSVIPTIEYARENRHPLIGDLTVLVAHDLGETDEERNMLAILKSNQHPDHDTPLWTPRRSGKENEQ